MTHEQDAQPTSSNKYSPDIYNHNFNAHLSSVSTNFNLNYILIIDNERF